MNRDFCEIAHDIDGQKGNFYSDLKTIMSDSEWLNERAILESTNETNSGCETDVRLEKLV